jgi:hypothetical protein
MGEMVPELKAALKQVSVVESTIEIDMTDVDAGKEAFLAECTARSNVTDLDTCNLAAAKSQEIKIKKGLIEAKFAPYVDKVANVKRAVEAVRVSVQAALASVSADYLKADEALRDGMKKWRDAEQIRIEEENRKAQEEARKKAEADRLAAAINAEANGDQKAADELIAAPIAVEPPRAVVMPKIAGASFATYWKYKSSSEPLDPAYTMNDELGFTVPDHKRIKATVTAMKEQTKIQGVEVYKETGTRI